MFHRVTVALAIVLFVTVAAPNEARACSLCASGFGGGPGGRAGNNLAAGMASIPVLILSSLVALPQIGLLVDASRTGVRSRANPWVAALGILSAAVSTAWSGWVLSEITRNGAGIDGGWYVMHIAPAVFNATLSVLQVMGGSKAPEPLVELAPLALKTRAGVQPGVTALIRF